MGDEIGYFRSFIAEKGLRRTPEREKIIEVIFSDPDHFDVDELYLHLRHKGSRVSKASIYRNIPLIMECGLIREVGHTDGHMHYEPVFGHIRHCHLRCVQCGTVIEFVEEELEEIEKRLAQKYDFQIMEHRLDVTGSCSTCKKSKNLVL